MTLPPQLLPLGDSALLIRFGETLDPEANRKAVAAALRFDQAPPEGVVEVAPGLVSVLLRYRPGTDWQRLRGDVMLALSEPSVRSSAFADQNIAVCFDGDDLADVASGLRLSPAAFVAAHNQSSLRVLATGFAPGFVYCGFHPDHLVVPRREQVRPMVPAGTVLFAAGQTAIAATPIRTGWHVIGTTDFRNFDPSLHPPTQLQPGQSVVFEAVA